MPAANTATAYGTVTRAFHWLTALMIFAAFPLGVIATDAPYGTAEELARKAQLFSVHKTLGVAIFAVALARILWALTQVRPVPVHPERRVETLLAEVVHWALYGSLVVVPLSGWVHHAALDGFAPILWPFGQGLPFVAKSEAVAALAGAVHGVFTKVLMASVALHVAGAVKHVVVDHDGVMARMLRGRAAGLGSGGAGSAGHGLLAPVVALTVFVAGGAVAWSLAPARAPVAVPAAGVAAEAPAGGNWAVAEGSLGFSVAQMGAPVEGRFEGWTAEIVFDEASGTGTVRVVVETGSLALAAVGDQAKGADFLNVAGFPEAVFEGVIAPEGEGFVAKGPLVVKGMSKEITLPFTLAIAGDRAEMAGEVVLDRRDFGVGQGFADESQVGFAVTVKVALVAERRG